MLRPRRSLQIKTLQACQKIKGIMNANLTSLSFVDESSEYRQYPIMNTRVANLLVKLTINHCHVVELNLNSCELSDATLQIISEGNWKSLLHLYLYRNRLTQLSFNFLKKGKWKKIQNIDLGTNLFKGKNAHILIKIWRNLQKFDISHNSLNNQFFISLIPNIWINLLQANLVSTNIENRSIKAIVKMAWPQLKRLFLQCNKITSDGLKVLVKGMWYKLQIIHLKHNMIGIEGTKFLTAMNCPNIFSLSLQQNSEVIKNRATFEQLQEVVNEAKCKYFSKVNITNSIIQLRSRLFPNQCVSRVVQMLALNKQKIYF